MTEVAGAAVVITGGASGIGRGIGEAMLAAGSRVLIADIDAEQAELTAREIGAEWARVDVTKVGSVEELARTSIEKLGSIDIVVNNAGVGPFAKIADLSMEDWRWILDVNLFGVIHCVHTFLPILKANESGGHMVNTTSMSSFTPFKELGAYAVSKFGISALTEVLRMELEEEGSDIRVTELVPGSVKTSISKSTRHRPEGQQGALHDAQIDLSFSKSSGWLEPREVGEIVVRAVTHNDRYAITHPDRWPAVASRHAEIEAAFHKY
jgi:NAD(P)-dependent dehydrogenase (short-subunit alcohol dehydrogenase family)